MPAEFALVADANGGEGPSRAFELGIWGSSMLEMVRCVRDAKNFASHPGAYKDGNKQLLCPLASPRVGVHLANLPISRQEILNEFRFSDDLRPERREHPGKSNGLS
jgi:hypothetical protein